MNICFDTSAINALCDDPDSTLLIAKIRSSHKVLLTSLSIVEVIANSSAERRKSLLDLLKALSDGTLPLAMPNKLVRRATRAFSKGKLRLMASITQEEYPTWWIVNDALLAEKNEQEEAFQWMKSLEEPFRQIHRDAREVFQQMLAEHPSQRPRSAGGFIKSFERTESVSGGRDALYKLVQNLYKKETSQHLSRDAMRQLFYRVPQWPLMLAGWAHEAFARAFQTSNYGPNKKPGQLDLWCAVYLPMCDVFVTSHNGQYRALRLINVLGRRMADRPVPRTRVLKYSVFRRTVLP